MMSAWETWETCSIAIQLQVPQHYQLFMMAYMLFIVVPNGHNGLILLLAVQAAGINIDNCFEGRAAAICAEAILIIYVVCCCRCGCNAWLAGRRASTLFFGVGISTKPFPKFLVLPEIQCEASNEWQRAGLARPQPFRWRYARHRGSQISHQPLLVQEVSWSWWWQLWNMLLLLLNRPLPLQDIQATSHQIESAFKFQEKCSGEIDLNRSK